MTDGIRVERRGAETRIVLDNPARKNALSQAGWAGLAEAVHRADDDPEVRVIVITGEGEDFSTGVDLADAWERLGRVDPSELTTAAESALLHSKTLTIAQVRGNCVGGGLMIAAACDFRLSASNARFALTPARLGLIYPASSVQVVVRLAGPSIAKRMLVAGEWLTAHQAATAGLVDHVFDLESLDDETAAFVARLSALSPISQASALEFIGACDLPDDGPDDSLTATRRWEAIARSHPDQASRIRGFLARNPTAATA